MLRQRFEGSSLIAAALICGSLGGCLAEDSRQPVAVAGEDIVTSDMTTVTLDATASRDPEGEALTYQWEQLDSAELTLTIDQADTARAYVRIPDVTSTHVVRLRLTVIDGENEPAYDYLTLTILDSTCVETGLAADMITFAGRVGALAADCGETFWYTAAAPAQLIYHDGSGDTPLTLGASPDQLIFDRGYRRLYLSHGAEPYLTVVDADNLATAVIEQSGTVSGLANDARGGVFWVSHQAGTQTLHRYSLAGESSGPWPIGSDAVRYNAGADEIVGVSLGVTPAQLQRYGFANDEMVLLQEVASGGQAEDLALSPGGGTLVVALHEGELPGFGLRDYAATDLARSYGEWLVGAYPTGVVYSPDGRFVAASNQNQLLVFETDTHTAVRTLSIPTSGCSAAELGAVAFSSGSGLVMVLQHCGSGASTYSRLHRFVIAGS